jgi:hypothetical protein
LETNVKYVIYILNYDSSWPIHYFTESLASEYLNLEISSFLTFIKGDNQFISRLYIKVTRGVAHLKELRRAEGGANILGVFRVKNHDFMPKNHIFSNFRGGAWIRPGIYRIITAGFSPVVLLPLYIILKWIDCRPWWMLGRKRFLNSRKLEKIRFFGIKSWFFTRNTPKMFAPPSARRNSFKCATPLTWNPGSAPVNSPSLTQPN